MKTIVLIEDDAAIQDTFSLALSSDQYKVIAYDSGNPVLLNEIDAPDLFIIDKSISGTNGLNVCRFIKNSRHYRRAPVIMISASPDIKELAKDVADDVMPKPFSVKELREIVSKYAAG